MRPAQWAGTVVPSGIGTSATQAHSAASRHWASNIGWQVAAAGEGRAAAGAAGAAAWLPVAASPVATAGVGAHGSTSSFAGFTTGFLAGIEAGVSDFFSGAVAWLLAAACSAAPGGGAGTVSAGTVTTIGGTEAGPEPLFDVWPSPPWGSSAPPIKPESAMAATDARIAAVIVFFKVVSPPSLLFSPVSKSSR